MPAPVVGVSSLVKWYGASQALRDVSISFAAGEVHAVAGENGAGKSTLVKILAGVIGTSQYTGTLAVDGIARHLRNVSDAEQLGIFLVSQELNIVPELSVSDFLFLNREPRRWGLVDTARLWRDAVEWLDHFQLDISPLSRMNELSAHQQQLVSIARSMTQGGKVVILDEPTASLTDPEAELLFKHIETLRAKGMAIVYISHRLREFQRIADIVTVMRDGRVVDSFRLDQVKETPRRIVKAMVGRDLDEMYPKNPVCPGKVKFELRDWSVANRVRGRRDHVKGLNLRVHAGEVLGIFGLVGSGTSQLARSIFGAGERQTSGQMRVEGRAVTVTSPATALRAGIAYLPAERKRDGLVLAQSVGTNISLSSLFRMTRLSFVDRARELERTQRLITQLRVKCRSIDQSVGELSGGNQQKVAAAKWLLASPEVFVMEEPTRGVDVGARIDFYELINELAAQAKAIILISTDLPEVLGMSDRIVAMSDGRIAGTWSRENATEAEVMLHAAGAHELKEAHHDVA